jgi:hypothetical protein
MKAPRMDHGVVDLAAPITEAYDVYAEIASFLRKLKVTPRERRQHSHVFEINADSLAHTRTPPESDLGRGLGSPRCEQYGGYWVEGSA